MSERKRAAAQVDAQKETVIYLGPEIPGIVSCGAVFNNGMPEKLKEAVKELQALNMLLVPVKKVVAAKKELKNETSAMGICYKKAVEYAAQKGARE